MVREPRRSRRQFDLSQVRLGLAVGMFMVAAMAASASYADAFKAPPLSTLVKFNDRAYEVNYADWVSLDPLSNATVRKIGYGHVNTINIATTSTGTYSSDALVSPHVQYPGISVRQVFPEGEYSHPFGYLLLRNGSSIFMFGRNPTGGRIYARTSPYGSRLCSMQGSFMACTTSWR